MVKYIIATLAFIAVWFAGFTIYIAVNGFNITYSINLGVGVAFLWVVSLVAAFCGYAAFKGEEE